MKVLIYGHLHHKNIHGIKQILNYLNLKYEFSNNLNNINNNCDIIYSPSNPINELYVKNKKIIYGPHFSVFPDNKLKQISQNQKAIYIQPSEWAKNVWTSFYKTNIPIHVFSFPVNTSPASNRS